MGFFPGQAKRERRRSRPQPHPFYSAALSTIPVHTRWAAACNAEFRLDGVGDLRGVLHHDGAILRFTTWGGAERFASCPMEFAWEFTDDGLLHITDRGQRSWFLKLEPLSTLVSDPPPFASTGEQSLDQELLSWMETWASAHPRPLTCPV